MSKIKLHSGIMFDFLNPTLETITLEDITHNLSKEERYGNCLEEDWCVLQHSLLVYEIVKLRGGSDYECYQALHHDDPEAYTGDTPTPFKDLLPEYKKIYRKIELKISEKFDVQLNPLFTVVQNADRYVLLVEDLLFSQEDSDWHDYTHADYKEDNKNTNGIISDFILFLRSMERSELVRRYVNIHNKLRKEIGLEDVLNEKAS